MGKITFAFGFLWVKNTFFFSAVLFQIRNSLDTESIIDSLKGWILFALSATFIIIKICKELKKKR
jgi:hypothetical protein